MAVSIKKVADVTPVGATVVDSLEKDSTTDAPSIRAVNQEIALVREEVEANCVKRSVFSTHTLVASSWTDKTYALNVEGVTDTSVQEILPDVYITPEQLEALQGANIVDGGQLTGVLVLKAFGDVPTIDIPIRVVLRGDL